MKVLLIGHGSIGKRYESILKHLEAPYEIHDPPTGQERDLTGYTHYIIASPTETHIEYLREIDEGPMVLCEKPVSKIKDEIPERANTYMVSNYAYVAHKVGPFGNEKRPYRITYNYYNTGRDGLYWDCCQLVYLDPKCQIETTSPRWNLNINGKWVRYRWLEESYVSMIRDFTRGVTGKLWTMLDAKIMCMHVNERIAKDVYNRRDSSPEQVHQAAR